VQGYRRGRETTIGEPSAECDRELLKAATARAVARAMDQPDPDAPPRQAIHAAALGVFDAIEAHPWVGAQLARPPWQATTLQVFESIGQQVQALGAPPAARFTTTSALLHYIIGASGQNATNTRSPDLVRNRQDALDTEAKRWDGLDPNEYPFTRSIAGQLGAHDDRAEYLAGIDLILAGMMTSRQQNPDRDTSSVDS
jgi:hypothetical protein